jgi:hypothetical protein
LNSPHQFGLVDWTVLVLYAVTLLTVLTKDFVEHLQAHQGTSETSQIRLTRRGTADQFSLDCPHRAGGQHRGEPPL